MWHSCSDCNTRLPSCVLYGDDETAPIVCVLCAFTSAPQRLVLGNYEAALEWTEDFAVSPRWLDRLTDRIAELRASLLDSWVPMHPAELGAGGVRR